MKTSVLVAILLAGLPAAAVAQEDVAAETARVNLEKARLDLAKSRADALSPLGSISGSADIKDSDKTAHGMRLRDAVYRAAAVKMVGSVGCVATIHPIVVFGITPPSVSAWWEFKNNKAAVRRNLLQAIADWHTAVSAQTKIDNAKPAGGARYLAMIAAAPVLIKALSTVASALAPQDSYSGASLKVPDTALGAALRQELAWAHCGLESDAFQVDATDQAEAYLADLKAIYTEAGGDLAEFKRRAAAVDKLDEKSPLAKAGQNLATAIGDYEALEKSLYADTNGRPKASIIKEQEELATSSRASRPILYIVDQDAALTTRARKGVRTLFASPVDLTATATVRYVLANSATPVMATVSCLLAPRSFDGALRYSPEASAAQCVQRSDSTDVARHGFTAATSTPGPAAR